MGTVFAALDPAGLPIPPSVPGTGATEGGKMVVGKGKWVVLPAPVMANVAPYSSDASCSLRSELFDYLMGGGGSEGDGGRERN